jgi:putative transcriptional regulator
MSMIAPPSKGDLLISEPFLPDPNFERSVILICEHNEDGSLGFVLNKPTAHTLNDVMDEASGFRVDLYSGGPVQENTLHFIHRLGDQIAESISVGEELFWGGDFEQVLSLINTGQLKMEDARFFIGYSGWSPGQLENELKENSWFVYKNATAEDVFDTSANDLWRKVLKNMGGKYRMFSNYPIDPRLN